MLPWWAQGFFVRSLAFYDPSFIETAVDQYRSSNFPLQGIALRQESLGGLYNFKYESTVATLKAKYNDTLNMILPFTFFVPSDSPDAIPQEVTVKGYDMNSVLGTINAQDGYCMDPFNPALKTKYLTPLFANKASISNYTAMWLEDNVPALEKTNLTDGRFNNPFYELPFIPGQQPLSVGTLPEYSIHTVDAEGTNQYHFNLHS
jgi:hypothetical protein